MKVITIGKSKNNDVVIDDGHVSRHHCQLISDGGQYRIVDLQSRNGTFVNGRRISGEMRLGANDVVNIGKTKLQWKKYIGGVHPQKYNPPPPVEAPPPPVIVQQSTPFIPENLNINQRIDHADVYRSGDDFKVPFLRNIGNMVGNTVGCLISIAIVVIVLVLIGVSLKGC